MINYNYIINIILIGDKITGKTTFFNKIAKNCFYYTYNPTKGVDYYGDFKIIDDKFIKVNIWDSGTVTEKLLNEYIKSVNIVIMFCDLNNDESQNFIIEQLKNKNLENKKIYILGNIVKNKKISIYSQLVKYIYNFNLKIITLNLKEEGNNILNFYEDIIKEAINFKNYKSYFVS
jgi:GTPase SAR1 family protein